MFANLMDRLLGAQKPQAQGPDTPTVFAALLVRIAEADGVFDQNERRGILRNLSSRYDLSDEEAQTILAAAEELEATAQDTQHFTSRIKSAVPLEDRFEIMVCVWGIVLADGSRAPEEDAMARLIAPLLGLDDITSAKARQRAQASL